MLLYMVADANRRGYGLMLDALWDEARGHGLELPTERPIAAASFCEARAKITPAMLRRMVHEVATLAFQDPRASRRWRGRRVFALDGTKINLQRSPDLHRAFGTPHDAHCPQLLLSVLLDVCTKHPVDFEIAPFASDERSHLSSLLPSLAEGDLLILDRGYPSHGMLQALAQAKIDVLVRVPCSNTFRVIDELRDSGADERVCELSPPSGSPEDWTALTLRAVRIPGPDGSDAYFLTSLPASEATVTQLGELYHLRWEVEEFFKLLKGPYIGQRQFRSKSPTGVRQEVSALVLLLAITRLCTEAVADSTEHPNTEANQKAAVLAVAGHLTRILLPADADRALRELALLLERVASRRYRRRAGRSCPRVSFKPTPRWGSQGRRGA
jgi:hypothetical protein